MLSRHFSACLIAGTLMTSTLLGTSALAQTPGDQESRAHVQAQATLNVAPDKATLSARLWERTPSVVAGEDTQADPEALKTARERLEKRTGELIRALEEEGLNKNKIRAGSLRIRPDYVYQGPARNGERETLVRTQLERPITLTLNDLERVPRLLDALTQAGVNQLDGVEYDLRDREAASDKALTEALKKARHKAQLMADTLGFELGEVASVRETRSPTFPPYRMAMQADSRENKGAEPEYRPGLIDIEAEVEVSWFIEPSSGE
ncbi:SIMPL domain-containing protein [Pistricoccus aurantiacus]|nr:SIMPL domain-containing protein [Pistricoccus aurantiacus]